MKFVVIVLVTSLFLYCLWKLQIIEGLNFSNCVKTWTISNSSSVIAFSPNGEMLATASGYPRNHKIAPGHYAYGYPSTVEIRKVVDDKIIRVFKFHAAMSLAFSPDNNLIAAGGYGIRIKIWRISDGHLIHSFDRPAWKLLNRTRFLAFTNDGQTLIAFTTMNRSPNQINVWDVDSGNHLSTFEKSYSAIDISSDGQILALVAGNRPASIALYRLSDGTLIKKLEAMLGGYSLKLSPDGKHLALRSNFPDGLSGDKISIHNIQDGTFQYLVNSNIKMGYQKKERMSIFDNHFAFSPDGRYLAVAYHVGIGKKPFTFWGDTPLTSHGRIRIWELKDEQNMWQPLTFRQTTRTRHLKNGQEILIKRWSWTLKGHEKGTNTLVFSPDGKWLVSAGKDNTIKFWRMPPRNYSWLLLLGAGGLISLAYWQRAYLIGLMNW